MTAAQEGAIHNVGSKVWVPDPDEAWAKAVVTKVDSDGLLVTVEETDELRKVKPEDAPLQNTDSRGVEVRARRS